jgi:hypothetical protein
MRARLAVIVTTLALAVSFSACNSRDCKPGTVAMKIYFFAPIYEDADRVIVTAPDPPGLDIRVNATRTAGVTDGVFLDVAFPHGYLTNTVITFVAQAFAGPVLIGQGDLTIHTTAQCSDGTIFIGPMNALPDAGP